jgi:hypothetical protein
VGPKDPWNWEDITAGARLAIIGARKNIEDPSIIHKMALMPILGGLSDSTFTHEIC